MFLNLFNLFIMKKFITCLTICLPLIGFSQTNLITNGDFATNVDGWIQQNFANAVNDLNHSATEGNSAVGAARRSVENPGTNPNAAAPNSIYQLINTLEAGNSYRLTFYVKSNFGGTDSINVQVYSQEAPPGQTDRVYVSVGNGDYDIASDNTWQLVTHEFTVPNPFPDNFDPQNVRIQLGVIDVMGEAFIDDVELFDQAQLSTKDFKNEEFASYNTANSFELNTDQKISSVKVYNISGQVVATESSNDSSVSVSTDGLSSGVYLVEATTVNGTKGLFKIAK